MGINFRFQDPDVGQVPVTFGVIQTVSDNKGVWQGEACIICFQINGTASRFVKQRDDARRLGVAALQKLDQMAERETAVDNIFDDQDVASFNLSTSKSLMILTTPDDFVDTP